MSNTQKNGGAVAGNAGGIDISQFFQVFFDKTAEHLATMESLLIAIDLAQASGDELNAIFRAAHSMKGGAGTFGFTDMTGVAHVLETLLDRVRKNELVLTSEMVAAFLQAGDVITAQLQAHRGGGELADIGPAREVCARLKRLTTGEADDPVVAEGSGGSVDTPSATITESLQPAEGHIKTVARQGRVVQVRGEYAQAA